MGYEQTPKGVAASERLSELMADSTKLVEALVAAKPPEEACIAIAYEIAGALFAFIVSSGFTIDEAEQFSEKMTKLHGDYQGPRLVK